MKPENLKLETAHAKRFYCADAAVILPLWASVYAPSIDDAMLDLEGDDVISFGGERFSLIPIVKGVLL